MTIRMLQAWNGLHQQKIVTTLSGSDEAALVAAGIATYDLDGPSENLRMAQLATDAGGVVGLSGGSPASGIPFGPPSTIFRLRMRCSGGSAVVTVAATKRSGSSDTFTFSLASGGDVSEPMYADDYSSLVWTKTGPGSVTLEVI